MDLVNNNSLREESTDEFDDGCNKARRVHTIQHRFCRSFEVDVDVGEFDCVGDILGAFGSHDVLKRQNRVHFSSSDSLH